MNKYRLENGDCKVHVNKTDLGKWVGYQRSLRGMTSKRGQLLDELGFIWRALPDSFNIPGGDARQNRAIAAKLIFPDLYVIEALRLGGFDEDWLKVAEDPTKPFRTNYVKNRRVLLDQIDYYEKGKQAGVWPSTSSRPRLINIENLVNTLLGDEEDRFNQVFGEHCTLLPTFLKAVEERKLSGVVESLRVSGNKKRKRMEQSEDDANDDDEDKNDSFEENI